jgi:hypothetical protein
MYPCVFAFFANSFFSACGSETLTNERQQTLTGLDARPSSEVYLAFQLPDRSSFSADPANLTSQIDSYYFRFAGQGPRCPTVMEQHEEWGNYEDKRVVGAKVRTDCDYLITIKIGSSRPEQLALSASAPINYQDDIKKTLEAQCVACHTQWQQEDQVVRDGQKIVNAVESGAMPPTETLSDAEIARFLAWADGGFLRQNPKPVVLTPKEQKLQRIFYRNNHDDLLTGLELLGVTTKDLRRSLWIQEDALTAQLKTRQLYTFPYAAE